MSQVKIFGDKAIFAVSCRIMENVYAAEENENYAYCHMIINDNLIGYPDEVCYLKTWIGSLSAKRDFISQNSSNLFPK